MEEYKLLQEEDKERYYKEINEEINSNEKLEEEKNNSKEKLEEEKNNSKKMEEEKKRR